MMVIRILLGFLGFVLLYVAAVLYYATFMYAGDRRQLKDRLATWWIRLDDRREKTRNWLHAFVPATAATVNQWYNHVFGPALLSSDFFITSTLLSSGCVLIALTAVQILVPHKVFPILRFDPEQAQLAYVISAASGVVMLYALLIVIRTRLRRMGSKLAVRRLLILAVVYITLLALYPLSPRYYEVNDFIVMVPVLGLAIGSDLFAIFTTRKALRKVMDSRSLPISFFALLLNSALAVSLIAIPALVAIILVNKGYVEPDKLAPADVPAMVATANLTVVTPAMVHFLAAATLLIHPAFAIVLRPLYFVEGEFPLTPSSRRALALAGGTLIAYAVFGYRGIEALKHWLLGWGSH